MFGLRSLDSDTRQQLLLVAIPPLIMALLLAGLAYLWSWQRDNARVTANAEKQLVVLQTVLKEALSIPLRDMSGIARAPLINEALSDTDPIKRRDQIANALYPLIYQNPDYFQVRWIRSSGMEGVRIELDRNSGEVIRTPPDKLQNKAKRDYHSAIMALKPFHLYLSPINLNREYGAIERPLRPTMRVAIRLPQTRDRDNGYLIINVSMDSILDSKQVTDGTDMELYMARPEGDWLVHPQADRTWATALGHNHRLNNDLPELWAAVRGEGRMVSYHEDGHWYVAPVTVKTAYKDRLETLPDPLLYLMLREPKTLIDQRRAEALTEALLVLAVLTLGIILFLIVYGRRLRQALELQRNREAQARALATKNQEIETLNRKLAERSERAESAARSKSTFLANMSHEIRTPMNAILGLLDMLEISGLKERQREQVTKIQGAARALLQILNDVLDLSKLEAGKFHISREPFVLEDVIRRCCQLFEPGFASKHLELLVWVDPSLPHCIVGDEHRLAQVLNNLLGNALKFTTHGSITVSVVQSSRQDNQLQVAFSVRDTGIGIPREKQPLLFGAFEQADASTTREFGGTGLGLAICQNLVNAMGGRIEVNSEVGQGTEFHFTLPYEIASGNRDDLRTLPMNRALVVEKHPQIASQIASCLDTWNIQHTVAGSAEDGVRQFLSGLDGSPYDAIISDWQLPGHDGLWLLESIQNFLSGQDAPPVPMVIMSEPSQQDELESRLAESRVLASLPRLLPKPVTPSALFEALHDGQPGPVTPKPAPETTSGQLNGARVLLAEDNELNQEVALGYLRRLGVHADLATDGAEAVTMVSSHPYDLVLMDLHMPAMDGLEACRAIRRHFNPEQLPVIAMTAAAFEDDILRSQAAGMNDHLSKPVSLSDLESALIRWLDRQDPPPSPVPDEGSPVLTLPEDLAADPDLSRRVLQRFVRRYAPADAGIPELPSTPHELRSWLHDLKGTAGTLGFHDLAHAATEAEREMIRTNGTGLSEAHSGTIVALLTSALMAARQWLDTYTPGQLQAFNDEPLLPVVSELMSRLDQSLIPTEDQLRLLERHAADPTLGDLIRPVLENLEDFRIEDAATDLRKLHDRLQSN